jgi:hypothetical protein
VDERVSFIDNGRIGGHFTVCAGLPAGQRGENEKQVRKRRSGTACNDASFKPTAAVQQKYGLSFGPLALSTKYDLEDLRA